MSRQFIDRLRLFVRAGSGAAGNPTLRGKGGNGGNVYLEVRNDSTLDKVLAKHPTKRFKATHGLEASKRRGELLGQNGRDVIIPVPPGVSVYRSDTSSANSRPLKLGDLDAPGQRLLVAQGGLGGVAQTGYLGSPGQAHSIVLDLKLMADYSLIGFPNAGKSSLLRAVSNANVKIASYPFTTVQPKLASCQYPDGRLISLADLPGLADVYADHSEAALDSKQDPLPALRHTNFLKHVERSMCLLLVLDAQGFQRNQHSTWRSPLAGAYLVLHMLERWSGGFLLEKPCVCVVNKIDLPDVKDAAEQTVEWLHRWDTSEARLESGLPNQLLPNMMPQLEGVHLISASQGTNVPELKSSLREYLDRIELRKRSTGHLDKHTETDDPLLFDRSTMLC